MLQACGRLIANVRLIGILKGTLPVTIRQRQSVPLLVKDLRTLQHSADGEVPLRLLFVMKFIQGVKEVSIEVVQGIVNWPNVEGTNRSTSVIAKIGIKF